VGENGGKRRGKITRNLGQRGGGEKSDGREIETFEGPQDKKNWLRKKKNGGRWGGKGGNTRISTAFHGPGARL